MDRSDQSHIKHVIEESIKHHYIGAGKRKTTGDHIFGLALPEHENDYVIRFRQSQGLISKAPFGYRPTHRLKELLRTSALTPPKFIFTHPHAGQPLLQCLTNDGAVAFDITERQPGETVEAWHKNSWEQFAQYVNALPDAKLDQFFETLWSLARVDHLEDDYYVMHNVMFDPKEGFLFVDKFKDHTYDAAPKEKGAIGQYNTASKLIIQAISQSETFVPQSGAIARKLTASAERVKQRIINKERPFDKDTPVFAEVAQVAAAPLRGELRFTKEGGAKALSEQLKGLEQAIGIA